MNPSVSPPPASAPKTVVVVGGGISGLTVAYRLLHPGEPSFLTAFADQIPAASRSRQLVPIDVVVCERGNHPGGVAWTEYHDGYLCETGPNGFLNRRPAMMTLCHELGLTEQLVSAFTMAAHRYVFLGDCFRRLPESLGEFLQADFLRWSSKLRLLTEPFWPALRRLEDESIASFGRRRLGKEATNKLLDAFITGIFAGDIEKLSMPACLPQLAAWEREHGSLVLGMLQRRRGSIPAGVGPLTGKPATNSKTESLPSPWFRRFWQGGRQSGRSSPSGSATQANKPVGLLSTTRGGIRVIMERLQQELGPALHLETAVTELQPLPGGRWRVRTEGKSARTWEADAVVLTSPGDSQTTLLAPVAPALAAEIDQIPYAPAIVVVLGMSEAELPLEWPRGFGYLVPEKLLHDVLGVIWSSDIFPEQAPPRHFALRAILGGWNRQDVLHYSDVELIKAVRKQIAMTAAISATPTFTWIKRWPRAIPQYHVGHLSRLERIEQLLRHLPGLFLGGNLYRGVGLEDCVREGQFLAQRLHRYFRARD